MGAKWGPKRATGAPQAAREKSSEKEEWIKKHDAMWKNAPPAQHLERWSSRFETAGVHAKRQIDLIDLAAVYCKEPVCIDLSQAAPRMPWSKNIRSMVGMSTIFSMAKQRVIVPYEHLRLLGWDSVECSSMTGASLRNLAGEGMGVPCVGFAALVMLLADDALWANKSGLDSFMSTNDTHVQETAHTTETSSEAGSAFACK
eukprot:5504964-Amphidinium_carterae.2